MDLNSIKSAIGQRWGMLVQLIKTVHAVNTAPWIQRNNIQTFKPAASKPAYAGWIAMWICIPPRDRTISQIAGRCEICALVQSTDRSYTSLIKNSLIFRNSGKTAFAKRTRIDVCVYIVAFFVE